MGFIEDLYLGHANKMLRHIPEGSRVHKLRTFIAVMIDELEDELTEGQCQKLNEMLSAEIEATEIENLDSFIVGFRAGAHCLMDVFSNEAPFEDCNLDYSDS